MTSLSATITVKDSHTLTTTLTNTGDVYMAVNMLDLRIDRPREERKKKKISLVEERCEGTRFLNPGDTFKVHTKFDCPVEELVGFLGIVRLSYDDNAKDYSKFTGWEIRL